VLEVFLFLRPFVVDDAIDHRIPAGAVVADTMFAQDAFLYAADLLHCFLRTNVLVGDAKLHPAETEGFKKELQQHQFTFFVLDLAPNGGDIPGVSDLRPFVFDRHIVDPAHAEDRIIGGRPDHESLPAFFSGGQGKVKILLKLGIVGIVND
jgi:hypothetical protein